MSQWKSYDILIQCVVHLSTCVHGSFQDWFQFPLRISIMSTALERWNLNASEFFSSYLLYLYFASIRAIFGVPACQIGKVVVVLLRAANMSAIPEFQAFSLSRDQSLHPDNTEKTPKRAGVLVQIQNWVSSVWKEKISSKVTAAASVDMLLRSHEFSLGVCPSHVRATLVRANHVRATLVLCIQSHINATLTGLNSYWMRQRFQFERSWGQIQSEQQQQIYTKPYGFFRSTIQDNSNYPFQTVYVGTFKNYSPHMAYNCRFNCNCWHLALR